MADLDCGNMPIGEVKVCDFEPWDLPEQSKVKSNDRTWYFFCPRDFKYANSQRSNRRTKMGFWKPTGKIRNVKGIRTKEIIGTKRTLVFYEHLHSGKVKTNWIMHEYEYIPLQGNFVVCKLKLKPDEKTKKCEAIVMAPTSPATSENAMTVTSSWDECDPNDNTSAHIEDHNVSETANNSTYENDEHSCATVCDIGNSYSIEVTSCSVSNESEGYHMISEYYKPNETLTFWKNKFSGQEAYVFKGRNSDKGINIFCSEKDGWSPFATSPDCGAGNKIPCLEADLSTSTVAAELQVIAEQPSIDVQGPPTFFDDMKMLIEPNGIISSNSPLETTNDY